MLNSPPPAWPKMTCCMQRTRADLLNSGQYLAEIAPMPIPRCARFPDEIPPNRVGPIPVQIWPSLVEVGDGSIVVGLHSVVLCFCSAVGCVAKSAWFRPILVWLRPNLGGFDQIPMLLDQWTKSGLVRSTLGWHRLKLHVFDHQKFGPV